MLRDFGRVREDGTPSTRTGDTDPADSVFVVLLAEDIHDARSWNVGSVWLSLGEAQGAARRYQTEGHKAHHGWQFVIVMEYQTGQLAPKAERHGDEMPFQPAGAIGGDAPAVDWAAEKAAMELEMNKLRAQLGQQQTVGVKA